MKLTDAEKKDVDSRVAEMRSTGVYYLRHPLPFYPGQHSRTDNAQLRDTRLEQAARRQLVAELSQ